MLIGICVATPIDRRAIYLLDDNLTENEYTDTGSISTSEFSSLNQWKNSDNSDCNYEFFDICVDEEFPKDRLEAEIFLMKHLPEVLL